MRSLQINVTKQPKKATNQKTAPVGQNHINRGDLVKQIIMPEEELLTSSKRRNQH